MMLTQYWNEIFPYPDLTDELHQLLTAIDITMTAPLFYDDPQTEWMCTDFGNVYDPDHAALWLEFPRDTDLVAGAYIHYHGIEPELQAEAMQDNYLHALLEYVGAPSQDYILFRLDDCNALPLATHVMLTNIWGQSGSDPPSLLASLGTYLDAQGRCRDERIVVMDHVHDDPTPDTTIALLFPFLHALGMLQARLAHLRFVDNGPLSTLRLVPGPNGRMM